MTVRSVQSQPAATFAPPAAGVAKPQLSTDAPTIDDFIGWLIGAELHSIVSHEQVARVGVDPDGVHQVRAASRRLRCHLRHYNAFIDPDWYQVTMVELRWLATTLGAVRDLEVMRDVLSACAASLLANDVQHLEPLFAIATSERNTAREALRAGFDSERYTELLASLASAAKKPPLIVDGSSPAVPYARETAQRSRNALDKAINRLGPTPTDAALHFVRLRAKRARFASEAAIPLFGTPARKHAKAMANLQAVLGTQHDAVVAHHWVRDRALHEAPAVSFSAGMVAGILRQASQQAAREFPEVWRKASRPKLRAWM